MGSGRVTSSCVTGAGGGSSRLAGAAGSLLSLDGSAGGCSAVAVSGGMPTKVPVLVGGRGGASSSALAVGGGALAGAGWDKGSDAGVGGASGASDGLVSGSSLALGGGSDGGAGWGGGWDVRLNVCCFALRGDRDRVGRGGAELIVISLRRQSPPSASVAASMPVLSVGNDLTIQRVSDVKGRDLLDALENLFRLSLIEVSGGMNSKRYGIHRLTETFLLNDVLQWRKPEGATT